MKLINNYSRFFTIHMPGITWFLVIQQYKQEQNEHTQKQFRISVYIYSMFCDPWGREEGGGEWAQYAKYPLWMLDNHEGRGTILASPSIIPCFQICPHSLERRHQRGLIIYIKEAVDVSDIDVSSYIYSLNK